MPPGWSPTQQPPPTPSRDLRRGSGTGMSSPFATPLSYAQGATKASVYSSAPGPAYGHPQGHLSSPYQLPRGTGTKIQGTYTGTGADKLHYEVVDQSFYVRSKPFFTEGRVLAMIMNETAGESKPLQYPTDYNSAWSGTRNINPNITPVKYRDDLVHTQTRRFVVVRQKKELCFACPIFTYSERATLKPGVKPEEHGIAYSWDQEPVLIPGESGITKASIGVVMADGEPPLDTASRIYFGIHHPIQYNVKVKEIGHVHEDHIHSLIENWNEENGKPDVTDNPDPDDHTEDDEDEPKDKKLGKSKSKSSESTNTKPDAYLYHADTNPYGYDSKFSPHVFHPKHNPHGYHPQHNKKGHHPASNPHMYHPTYNPHGYHPKDNPRGYHPMHNPHMYHPTSNEHGFHSKHNPYGYHPERNSYGYHPESNPHMLHPSHNPRGYHPKESPHSYHPHYNIHGYDYEAAPFSYHPHFCPHGYHQKENPRGYHPDTTPYAYHPQENPFGYHSKTHPTGYHPIRNPHGYHPRYNRHGYHPEFNSNAYHPTLQPQGVYISQEDDVSEEDNDDENEADDNQEDDEEEEEEDDLYTAA